MNKHTRDITVLLTATCFTLTSCAQMGTMLEDTQKTAAIGAALGAVAGAAIGGGNNRNVRRNAALGGLAGAGAGALVSMAYKASLQQQQQARERANYALAHDRSIMKSVKASGADYVAVKVKPKAGAPDQKSRLIKVKVKENADGTMSAGEAGGTAYPVEPVSSGESLRLGMNQAIML
jgi:hypothetical protein